MFSPYRGRGFYDPLSEMNRLFAQVFGLTRNQGASDQRAAQGSQATQEITAWAPAIDVVQRDEDLVVRAELPGVTPDDVDITIQNGVLTISGRISEQREEEREGYLVREAHGDVQEEPAASPGCRRGRCERPLRGWGTGGTIKGAAAGQEPKRVQIEGQNGATRQEEGDGSQ